MVAVHLFAAAAHKETARQALLAQLQKKGATSRHMPASLEVGSEDAQAALAELLSSGGVREVRPGLYYLGEASAKESKPGTGFVALLAILVILSFTASLIALAVGASQN